MRVISACACIRARGCELTRQVADGLVESLPKARHTSHELSDSTARPAVGKGHMRRDPSVTEHMSIAGWQHIERQLRKYLRSAMPPSASASSDARPLTPLMKTPSSCILISCCTAVARGLAAALLSGALRTKHRLPHAFAVRTC